MNIGKTVLSFLLTMISCLDESILSSAERCLYKTGGLFINLVITIIITPKRRGKKPKIFASAIGEINCHSTRIVLIATSAYTTAHTPAPHGDPV